MFLLPLAVQTVLKKLNQSGFEAYLVGGCVRDFLLQKRPQDFDITTSATPEEMRRCFSGLKTVDTGVRHGTLTVLVDAMSIEVTTFRTEGVYSDHRRPDSVSFTRCLKKDLKRRDFTINAMAYHPETGLVDLFHGQSDLRQKQIRCVGNADKRFSEDALRMLRALRFASVLGFRVEKGTAESLHKNRGLLKAIAGERIYSELLKLLCGDEVLTILLCYPDVLSVVIPELQRTIGFEQNTPYHIYPVYEHIAHTVAAAKNEPVLRLTMLLHDIGKPLCYHEDKKNIGHFFGHAKKSEELAKTILCRLHADNVTTKRICTLIRLHSCDMSADERWLRRFIRDWGLDVLLELIEVKIADNSAKNPDVLTRLDTFRAIRQNALSIANRGECCTLKQLAVDGRDLMEVGVKPGVKLGQILHQLLDAVINNECINDREALLAYAKQKLLVK